MTPRIYPRPFESSALLRATPYKAPWPLAEAARHSRVITKQDLIDGFSLHVRHTRAEGKSGECHACGHVQDIEWAQHWICESCSASHQRDDNAAINLARYEETISVVGPVGAAVKRGADRKTRLRRAGGREARKGRGRKAAEQPRDGVQVA
ncbi:zinc ribbon domain-containing protein [Mycobacterium sp. SM1]|uniref:zinc ribbon domain-containing protein n=1 Tax=Mycobacterium sp. SM1 TaxID=2816243 RepID=UPI002493E55D|nr:zinc ribbon domain-containing protein [Mycobacterium sp. SM1]